MQHLNNNHPTNSFTMESFCILFYNSKIKLLLGVIFLIFQRWRFHKVKATLKKWFGQHFINSEFNRKLSIIDGQRIKDSIKR
jgi:hypothetical protein